MIYVDCLRLAVHFNLSWLGLCACASAQVVLAASNLVSYCGPVFKGPKAAVVLSEALAAARTLLPTVIAEDEEWGTQDLRAAVDVLTHAVV